MMHLNSFFYKKILNRKKGSLTVEAAIVLPIFICVILMIGFFIKLVHTHEVIQYAINEAANDMASSSYIYYSTGLYEIETSIYDSLTERKSNLEEQREELERILSIIEMDDIGNGQSSQGSQGGFYYKNLVEVIEKISHLTDIQENSNEGIEGLFNLINTVKVQGIDENIKNIAAAGELELYQYLKNQIGNMIMKEQLKKHLITANGKDIEERLRELHIVMPTENDLKKDLSQFYGLDFSRSSYLYGNDNIDIVVMYKIDLPLPIDFVGEISMIQRATARAWLGGTNPTLIIEKSNEGSLGGGHQEVTDEEEDLEQKSKVVYITRTGECYHKGHCYHLRQSKIPANLKEILEEGIYRPCSHCYGD